MLIDAIIIPRAIGKSFRLSLKKFGVYSCDFTMANILEKVAKLAIPIGAAVSLFQYSIYDGGFIYFCYNLFIHIYNTYKLYQRIMY